MNDKKQVTQKRSWLFIISVIFNVFLLVPFIMVLASFIHIKCKYRNLGEDIIPNIHTGLTLISLTGEALREQPKQNIVVILETIYEKHPSFSRYKKHYIYGKEEAEEKDCIYYAGTYFVFRDAKFAFFDTDLKCEIFRFGDRFYSKDLIK